MYVVIYSDDDKPIVRSELPPGTYQVGLTSHWSTEDPENTDGFYGGHRTETITLPNADPRFG